MEFFRTLLLCLLVLAVPAQGSAAVTMAFCGPNHHGAGQVLGFGQAAKAEHVVEHGTSGVLGVHDRDDHFQASADRDVPATDRGAAHTKFVDADKHKCSACASCCSLAALLGTMPLIVAPSAASTVFESVVPIVDAAAADGLERPPRPLLA